MVTGPGNVYLTAAKRLLRGLIGIDSEAGPDRDRDPRRRHGRPGARRRRPDQPGRARPARRERCWSRLATSWPTRWTPSWRGRSRPPSTPSASAPRCSGTQSGCVLVSDCGRRARGRRRLRRRAPGDPDRATPRAVAARVRNAGRDLRRAAQRRCRSATTARAPTTCCPPAAARGTRRACPCRRSCAASTSIEYTEDALREVADQVRRAGRRRGPARARPGRHGAVRERDDDRSATRGSRSTTCRCARTCAARRPTARRSSTSRCGSTPTRTRTRRRPSWSPTSPRPSPRRPAELHRYPDRDAVALRADLAALPDRVDRRAADARRTCGRPTGPTRCSSRSCRRSAGRAARRWASSRRTRCTRSSPPAPAPSGCRRRAAPTSRSTSRPRPRLLARARAGRRVPDQPEQPDRRQSIAARRPARG